MDKSQEILDRIVDIEKSIEFVEEKFTFKKMFLMGTIKGMGAIIGAIVLILMGGWLLKIMGVIPGLEELSVTILEAYDAARLR